MTASINFHGPYTYRTRHHPAGTVKYHPNAYSSFSVDDGEGSDATLYFDSRGALDDLIEAAAALRSEWPEPAPDPDILNDAVAAEEDPFGPVPVHGENHIGNDGQVVSAIHPGECIGCHGHATADGIFHPAVAS